MHNDFTANKLNTIMRRTTTKERYPKKDSTTLGPFEASIESRKKGVNTRVSTIPPPPTRDHSTIDIRNRI